MSATEVEFNHFESLPARPPTPPRETNHEADAQLQKLPNLLPDSRLPLSTPPNGNLPSDIGGSSRRKRVEFSAQASYKEAPVYTEGKTPAQNPTPVSLSSSASRPAKSILKVTYGPNPLAPGCGTTATDGQPLDPENFVNMLDSSIQQLAGADRDSKLDCYLMLVRVLKASNNLPDRMALQDKMTLFMSFIQRDMNAKLPSGSIDATLVNHALNLLSTFLHFPAIASTLSDDFGVTVMDHCIRSFGDTAMPKDVARHLMQVVALQSFPPKVMTSDRVGRLVTSLRRIEEHMAGKSIVMSRILIYRRLIKQCGQHMVKNSDWLQDLFTDMLSSMKEIRTAAITLGLESAFSLGRDKAMSQKIVDLFGLTLEDKTYITFYDERLRVMMKDKQVAPSVPRIWSVVILFLRQFERWKYFSVWLRIIQDCFNSTDHQTKYEANLAWSRLIYNFYMEEKSFTKMIPTLVQPLQSQLKGILRKNVAGKGTQDLRRVLMAGVCSLYYYTFRPVVKPDFEQLDKYWDSTVKPIQLLLTAAQADAEASKENFSQASMLLIGLFDCQTQRLWKEGRASEPSLIKAAELPQIDSQWVRRNPERVFNVLRPILEKHLLDLSNTRSITHKLWLTVMQTIASASSKDIKVAQDTNLFIGHALGFIMSLWNEGHQSHEDSRDISTQFIAGMQELLLVMIDKLGYLPFTEKLFSVDRAKKTFAQVATPSHRPGKGPTANPLGHLFTILSALPPGVADDETFANFFKAVFNPILDAKNENHSTALAQDLLQSIPADALCPYGPWLLAADKISASLELSQHSQDSGSSNSDTPLGHEYRDLVKVLERGIRSHPNLPWAHWRRLFCSLAERVREEAGDAGVAMCLIEPLSKVLLDSRREEKSSQFSLSGVAEFLSHATHPRDRQAFDAARRRLWGTTAGTRSVSFDPFDSLYKLVSTTLSQVYEQLQYDDLHEAIIALLKEVRSFLDRSNSQLMARMLASIQDGLACWIKDDKAQLDSRQRSAVTESTKALWDKLCLILEGMDRDKVPLEALETLFCAAFESKHRHMVNSVSIMWNRMFDQAEVIKYPEKLKAVLLSRRPFVDIVLPGLELEPDSVDSGAGQLDFIDSQQDMALLNTASSRSNIRSVSRGPSVQSSSPMPVRLSVPTKRQLESSPAPAAKKAARRPTPRLRHDDSQIQFATIASPTKDYAESQVLTDRQREVRERQQREAALFPEIRSSPGKPTSASCQQLIVEDTPEQVPQASQAPIQELEEDDVLLSTPSPQKHDAPLPRVSPRASPELEHQAELPLPRATTPAVEQNMDDYITSTPTPRRGQHLPLPESDNDLVDVPSSPPEPRPYPLLPHVLSRSAERSMMEQWQFSSSPPGSPIPAHNAPAVKESVEDISEHEPEAMLPPSSTTKLPEIMHANKTRTPSRRNRTQVDSPQASLTKNLVAKYAAPETPTGRRLRSAIPQETPKSDNEVFVDAPTSPLPPTPKPRSSRKSSRSQRAPSASQSSVYGGSDMEASMMRLVVELPPGKPSSPEKYQLIAASSPDVTPVKKVEVKKAESSKRAGSKKPGLKKAESAPADCITVYTDSQESSLSHRPAGRGRPRKHRVGQRSSSQVPSTPVEGSIVPSSQVSVSSALSSGGKKRKWKMVAGSASQDSSKKSRSQEPSQDNLGHSQDSLGQIPDSQVLPMAPSSFELSQGSSAISESQEFDPDATRGSSALNESQEIDPDMTRTSTATHDPMDIASEDVTMEVQAQLAMEQREAESQEVTAAAAVLPESTKAQEVAVAATVEQEATASQEAPASPPSKMQELMSYLFMGLTSLKSAALSRGEVSEVEDLCMDIKRELYEAERRGRDL